MKLVGSFEFDLTSGKFLYFVHITFSRWKNERKFYISLFFHSVFFFSINPKFNWTAAIFPPTPSVPISLSAISSVPELIILHTNSIYNAGGLSYLSRHPFSKFNFQTNQRRVSVSFFNLVIFPSPLSLSYTRGFPWTSNQKIKSISLSLSVRMGGIASASR